MLLAGLYACSRGLDVSTERVEMPTVLVVEDETLFTDIDMPGSMDGLKLAAAVRDRWPPVHIIITTGKVRPLEIPANALFIPKPYVGKNVVAAMRTFENMN
ncbi:response regulator [Bradyrhizobium sp. 2S1]|uniref:response regulator n=1 Tax=Bradyrhizobium sp. 2S1 TaxID=1404429 RepID=UPI001CD104CA|nr:response regulator [Bradyrhizobium sp. 2S1]MCK7673486.1 response regulator [Bradyrhizobium sp. 2S1]